MWRPIPCFKSLVKNVLTDVANVLPGSHVLSPDLILPFLLSVSFFSVSEHGEGALLSSSPDLPLSNRGVTIPKIQ